MAADARRLAPGARRRYVPVPTYRSRRTCPLSPAACPQGGIRRMARRLFGQTRFPTPAPLLAVYPPTAQSAWPRTRPVRRIAPPVQSLEALRRTSSNPWKHRGAARRRMSGTMRPKRTASTCAADGEPPLDRFQHSVTRELEELRCVLRRPRNQPRSVVTSRPNAAADQMRDQSKAGVP